MNALVVGAGGFGKHYARILSRLDPMAHDRIPGINKLIISRTRYASAKHQAEEILNDAHCRAPEILPVQVNSAKALRRVLSAYTPSFIGIAARDKICGDEIHPVYTREALAYGSVLCEKPFCPASGDGSSLKHLNALKASERAVRFGMDLPFSVVKDEMLHNEDIRTRLIHAEQIDFFWETRVAPENYIINDLALHPWSLIPDNFQIKSTHTQASGNQAFIELQLKNSISGDRAACRMTLKDGGTFRGMWIDGYPIGIFNKGPAIQLVELSRFNSSVADASIDADAQKVLVNVDNPLKQHIISVLCGSPLVDLPKIQASQLFLEQVHGFKR